MRAAAVQLNSTGDRGANLAAADRLTRAAAADGASLVVLPEKWTVLGTARRPARGRRAAGRAPRELGARARTRARASTSSPGRSSSGSPGGDALANTSRARRPRRRGARGLPQDPHVRRRGRRHGATASPSSSEAGDEIVLSATRRRRPAGPDGLLRRALPRALPHPRRARRAGARRAGRVHAGHHARPLGDARCAPARSRTRPSSSPPTRSATHAAGLPLGRALDDRRPVGAGAGAGARRVGHIVADLDLERQQRDPARRCPRWPTAARGLSLARGRRGRRRHRLMEAARTSRRRAAQDKRRVILDAAVRVFARQGFHACRVSDIADEAGVAYGLVYHYFALQGRGARHAVPRALERDARR